jgi:ADP-ribose pyrophosphatase YjhB (NUDIX family)
VLVLYAKDKNSLVLARRAHDPGKGKLDFVGGFLDAGEDFETAAYRELKEETGLEKEDVGQLDYLCSFYNGYMWEGVELPTTSACFLVAIDDKKSIHPSDDVASVEYITSNQLPVGADGAWLNMDKVLQLAAQRLRSM